MKTTKAHETTITSQRPKYWAGGFTYDQRLNGEGMDYLTKLGYDVVPALSDPDIKKADKAYTLHRFDTPAQVSTKKIANVASKPQVLLNISNYQLARAKELIKNLDNHGKAPVDAIFQSADALNGLLAMHERPDLFHNVVLAFPAGIVKQQHPAKSSINLFRTIYVNSLKKHKVPKESSFEPIRDSLRLPKAGGRVTVKSAAFSYQRPLLTNLRRRKYAPGVSIVVGTKDYIYRPDRIIESLGSANDVDFVLVTNSPHGIRGHQEIMNAILALFPKMEQLKAQHGDAMKPLAERLVFMDDVPQTTRNKLIRAAAKVDARARRASEPEEQKSSALQKSIYV